jgi:translation elongation factor EF-1alpha
MLSQDMTVKGRRPAACLKLMCVFIHVVTTLGNSHGDDVGVGVRHLLNNGLTVVRCEQVVGDTSDDARTGTFCVAFNHCVEVVLLRKSVAHGSSEWLKIHTADRPVLDIELLKKRVDVDRQMSSVEAANSYVDNALLDILSLVCWYRDIVQLGKILAV